MVRSLADRTFQLRFYEQRPQPYSTMWRLTLRKLAACGGGATKGVWGLAEVGFYADDTCEDELPVCGEGERSDRADCGDPINSGHLYITGAPDSFFDARNAFDKDESTERSL